MCSIRLCGLGSEGTGARQSGRRGRGNVCEVEKEGSEVGFLRWHKGGEVRRIIQYCINDNIV